MLFFSFKVLEPVFLLGKERFAQVDMRIRVKGGGQVSQIYGKRGGANAHLPRSPDRA